MDLVAVGYYSLICAVFGWVSPMTGRPRSRVMLGIIIGAGAAIALPTVRAAIG